MGKEFLKRINKKLELDVQNYWKFTYNIHQVFTTINYQVMINDNHTCH